MRCELFPRLLSVAALLGFATPTAFAQVWEDEFPVTQDPVPQYRSYLAVDPGDYTYVLWPDWTDFEDTQVTLTRSDDLGRTWNDPIVVFRNRAIDNFDLKADEHGLHLLLVDFRENDSREFKDLYYLRSTDRGETFSAPVRIGTQRRVEAVKLLAADGKLFVYMMDFKNDNPAYHWFVSHDQGASWNGDRILFGAWPFHPDFTWRDGVLHMVYRGLAAATEIQYRTSVDDGATWSSPTVVDAAVGEYSQLPAIALDDAGIHVTWEDNRSGVFNVRYARSLDGGASFEPSARVNLTKYGARTRLLATDSGLHAFWCQYHGDSGWPTSWGSGDYGIIWSRTSLDSGQTWSQETRVSQNESIPNIDLPDKGANYVKVESYRSGHCALWQDKRDGNFDLYLRNRLPLAADAHSLTLAGGAVEFQLDAGPAQAGRDYLVFGTVSGTRPGLPLPGGHVILPINYDTFTGYLIRNLGSATFHQFLGTLDGLGTATATLQLPALDPELEGLILDFGFALAGPWDYASNPSAVEIVR